MGWCMCAAMEGGELGVGGNENRVVPTLVRGELQGRKVLQVAAGVTHTVCVTADLHSVTTSMVSLELGTKGGGVCRHC